jgi:Flp pilus assembly protein TadG
MRKHDSQDCLRAARLLHRQEGATIAELAIVMPLFLLLTLGAFELGRGVWVKHSLTHLAREAARYASVRSADSDDPVTTAMIESRVKSEAIGIDTDALSINASWEPANVRGGTVEVDVSYDFAPATPLLPFSSIALASSSRRIIAY